MRLRSTLTALTLAAAIAAPAAAIADDKARTYTRDEIEKIVIQTLMDKPEVIIEAVQQMQVREQANQLDRAREAVAAYRTSLFEDKDTPTHGAEDADIVIVEFFDYNCGYCRRSLPNVTKLLENDKKVRVVFKEYPMLSPTSEDAARASLAMYYVKPEKYLEFHSAMFRMNGRYDEASVTSLAESLGAKPSDFKKALHSDRVSKQIEETRQLAAKMGVSGVPAFIIGGEIFPGAISYEMMKQQVDAVREAVSK